MDQSVMGLHSGHNILGLTLAFDNNMIGNELRATRFLNLLSREGCIRIVVSDDVDNELHDAPDVKFERLTEDAFPYSRNFGVWVLGYSAIGSMVLGAETDIMLMDEIRSILKPGVTDWEKARPQDVRDAKHLHTAIRYGMDAFVTLDDNFHRKADQLRSYIPVWTPRKAAQVAVGRLRSYRKRTDSNPN